jgi:hypothetical protein
MNIEFTPRSLFAQDILPKPLVSKKFIPEWYSKMNIFFDNDKQYGISKFNKLATNTTMKSCTPFLDALMFGYMWYLPMDLEIRFEKNNFNFNWKTDNEMITRHEKDQHPSLPKAFNGHDFVAKFTFDFIIKTPKGYSTLFTHPLNRHDLPFRTFSGVVDTDKYTQAVQFPFQMLNIDKNIFILEKETPLCQIIPFKRDDWKSSFKNFNNKKIQKDYFNFKSVIKKSYKNQYWSQKKYS